MDKLNQTAETALIKGIIQAFIDEQESKWKTSEPDGCLQLGVDERADLMVRYIKPHLSGYEQFLEDFDVFPVTPEVEKRITEFEERAYDMLVQYERQVNDTIVDHMRDLLEEMA